MDDMLKLISDYLEAGYLDNIIDMFRHDKSLYKLIPELIKDERIRVRIGTVALVESLIDKDRSHIISLIPHIAVALKNENATIRGDAAYLLGVIGHRNGLPYLKEAIYDTHELVRETILDAIKEIEINTQTAEPLN
jgi:HEAT repeat protein